jgi:outer membrane protein OmpA-like peptidoglycan-associated protein
MLYRILVFLVLFIPLTTMAQEGYSTKSERAIKFYEEGRENYRLFYYDEAEKLLLKSIDADKNFMEPYMVLAKLYWDRDSLEKAVDMYNRGLQIDPGYYTYGFFYKGALEIKLARYAEAVISFSRVLELETKDLKLIALSKKGLANASYAVEAFKNPVEFKPERLSESINTDDDEYWPCISADENDLVFTRLVGSASGSNMQEDFYESEWKNNAWTPAKNVGYPLNTFDNEGAQSLSADGQFMVYTVCNRRGVLGRCDLYASERKGDSWSIPQNIGAPVNSAAKETQPGLSADGRTIYFVSDRAGGKGGLDIWLTHKSADNSWSNPENLGDSVNSPGNESSPFIHPDNNTLYFSSDYLPGMGGFDIFYSRRNTNGSWGRAINLGYPINTNYDEIGLVITAKGDKAYYSTNRNSSKGRDIFSFDLYKKARPQEVSYLKGKVFDASNKKQLKASFELVNLATGEMVSKSQSDEITGEFLVCIPTNCNYMLNVSKEGYLFFSENFSLNGIYHLEKPFYKNIPLQPISIGQTMVLKNIFFETDSFNIRPESKIELNKLVQFLMLNPAIKVQISGHTDNAGSQEHNQLLSENRAKSVIAYLILNGIKADRLTSVGYGYSKPIDTNETAEGRANNRRTELTIIN